MNNFRMGLMAKILLTIFLLGVVLTVLYVSIQSEMFLRVLHNQQKAEFEAVAEHVSASIDWVFQEMEAATLQCSLLIQMAVEDSGDVAGTLETLQHQYYEWVRRAYFVDAQGEIYSSHQVELDVLEKTLRYDLPARLAQSAPKNGAIAISDVYRSSMITADAVAFTRRVFDGARNPIGTVVLEMELETLGARILSALGATQPSLMLVTDSGTLAYWHSSGSVLPDTLTAIAQSAPQWSDYADGQGVHYRVYRRDGGRHNDWSVLIVLNESNLRASLWELAQQTSLVSVVLFLLALFLLAAIVGRYIRPIRRLADQMNAMQLQADRLTEYTPLARRDEIGDLSRSFAAMLNRINLLLLRESEIRQKRHEAEIKALQYQLRPHFLYNTLNAFSALALRGEVAAIPPAVSALIHMLATSTDKTGALIPLAEECRCCEEFVRLLQLRYGDTFDLLLRIPEALSSLFVPKLILQPIIENSVFHGFLGLKRRGLIEVKAERCKEDLIIVVMDNGHGMPPEKAASLPETPPDSGDGLRSTGLYNTHSRIRLYFGETYGLSISSVLQVGTQIVLRLPVLANIQELEEKKSS